MQGLKQRLELASVILQELSREPLSRTALEKYVTKKGGTHATFEGIFKFLIQNGYVMKSGPEKRAPYCITEKGSRFLEGLS